MVLPLIAPCIRSWKARHFSDPFAVAILATTAARAIGNGRRSLASADAPVHRGASRFSEDTLAACVARGVRQVVVLGAGLDTFSLRNPHASQGVRMFEVDYRQRRAEAGAPEQAGLAIPALLTFAPIDFERQKPGDGLRPPASRLNVPPSSSGSAL